MTLGKAWSKVTLGRWEPALFTSKKGKLDELQWLAMLRRGRSAGESCGLWMLTSLNELLETLGALVWQRTEGIHHTAPAMNYFARTKSNKLVL